MYHRFQHIYPLENEAKRTCFEWFEWPANASNAVNDMPRYASWPFMDITILLHLRSSSWANPSHNATIFHGSSSLWNLLLSASHTSWTCWRDSQWISQERTSWSPGNVNGACPNHRATLNRSEQIWTKHNLTSRHLTRGRGVLDSLGPRGAWSLHLLLHSSLHLRPRLGAEHSWGNPELRHLWKMKDLHAQRCSRGLDLMSMSTAYRWGTNYALIMHWLCLSLQFATAVGRREEIVTDSHCRAFVHAADCVLLRLQRLERTKSEWSPKLLVLASESWESESVPDGSCLSLAHDAWGRLPRPTCRPLSAQHALSSRKQSNTKNGGKNSAETILKYVFTASNPCRFVANLSGSHQRNFQRPEKGATSSQDELPPGLRIQISDTEKLYKTI